MRQAGRFLPEYRAIREKYAMLETINTPELAAELTLQPVRRFDVDAGIIFSDILPPLVGMGLKLDFVKGVGPRLENKIYTTEDIDRLGTPPAAEMLAPTLEAIRMAKRDLSSLGVPLIGFCGAPFTLASYAIEGGGSKNYRLTKTLMYSEPAAWKRLMDKLVTVLSDYLIQQAAAGVDVLQVFDSWAGALGQSDYKRYVQPHNRALFERVSLSGTPIINFSTGTSAFLGDVAECGGDVVGVDWHLPLDAAWEKIGSDRGIMGNLDPVTLLGPWRELKAHADEVLDCAANRNGHIFNLGHGILPQTPIENVERLVSYVHERTTRDNKLPFA